MEEQALNDLFHLVYKALPEGQDLEKIPLNTSVAEAFQIMDEKKFSQLLVVTGGMVLGVFSYRSFVNNLSNLPINERTPLLDMPVEEFMEDLKFVHMKDQMDFLIDELEGKDGVLLGSKDNTLGIITTIDMLKYFYDVARPFVMLLEIELALRELIRASVTSEELDECTKTCLTRKYEELGLPLPTSLEKFTLADYDTLLNYHGHWDKFRPTFGGTVLTCHMKLKDLHELRNKVFHFRGEPSFEEYENLRNTRDWLIKRAVHIDELRKEATDEPES